VTDPIDTWIRDPDNVATVAIRDEGNPIFVDVNGTETRIMGPHKAWPEDHFVHVKRYATEGDRRAASEITWKSERLQTTAGGNAEQVNLFMISLATLASCASSIVRFEGRGFTDPKTGRPLELPPEDHSSEAALKTSMQARIAKLELVPTDITQFVGAWVDRNSSPFALTANANGSKSVSDYHTIETAKAVRTSKTDATSRTS